jgi:hypothetical protein
VQVSVQKLHAGDLVDLIHEPGRVFCGRRQRSTCVGRASSAGSTQAFTAGIEAELSGGERHRLTTFLERVDDVLETPRQPSWWLAP